MFGVLVEEPSEAYQLLILEEKADEEMLSVLDNVAHFA